jgi:Fe2+ or Zn2+ uptake regulation protein
MKKHFYHQAILKTCTHDHLSVDEIFEAVKKEFPNAGYSTVYRNVEELAEKRSLKKITGIGSKALFERAMDDHTAHFVDETTGKIYDIRIPESAIYPWLPEGFAAKSADVRIYGEVRGNPSEIRR